MCARGRVHVGVCTALSAVHGQAVVHVCVHVCSFCLWLHVLAPSVHPARRSTSCSTLFNVSRHASAS